MHCHPSVHQKALIEVARRLLSEGVQVTGKASLYQESHTLTLTGTGSLSAQEREDLQQQFSEETGWTLDLHIPLEEIALPPES